MFGVPSGYYCVNGTVTLSVCPIGHYCPEGTTFDQEYPCPPGTFNNVTGQLTVSLCLRLLLLLISSSCVSLLVWVLSHMLHQWLDARFLWVETACAIDFFGSKFCILFLTSCARRFLLLLYMYVYILYICVCMCIFVYVCIYMHAKVIIIFIVHVDEGMCDILFEMNYFTMRKKRGKKSVLLVCFLV